jgi:hypothetical protein
MPEFAEWVAERNTNPVPINSELYIETLSPYAIHMQKRAPATQRSPIGTRGAGGRALRTSGA